MVEPTILPVIRIERRTKADDLHDALKDMLRILDAVRMTVGLGKKQLERIERARAALADPPA